MSVKETFCLTGVCILYLLIHGVSLGHIIDQLGAKGQIVRPSQHAFSSILNDKFENRMPDTEEIYTVLEIDLRSTSTLKEPPGIIKASSASSTLPEGFNFIASMRSDLESSISSWSLSNFNYATVPSHQAQFRENVDYYFIDDSNSTRSLDSVNLPEPTPQLPSLSSTNVASSQITPNESEPRISATQTLEIDANLRTTSVSTSFDNPVDSAAIVNDSIKSVTNRTPKLTGTSAKDESDRDNKNEIKPSPTRRTPTSKPSHRVEDRMEYHPVEPFVDSAPLRSSLSTPTLVYVPLFSDIKRDTDEAVANITRPIRPRVPDEPVKEIKTEEPLKVLTITNIPISSNIIKYSEEVPKVIDPKYPYPYTDKVKPNPSKSVTEKHVLSTLVTASTTIIIQSTWSNFVTSSILPAINESSAASPNTLTEWKKKYPVLVEMCMATTWDEFCSNSRTYQYELTKILRQKTKANPNGEQIFFLDTGCARDKTEAKHNISVFFLVQDPEENYNQTLTLMVGEQLKLRVNDYAGALKLQKVSLVKGDGWTGNDERISKLTKTGVLPFSHSTVVTGIVLSVIAAICLVTLSVILLVAKQKGAHSTNVNLPSNVMDGLNMDSFPNRTSSRRKRGRLSLRSFLNQAFDEPEFPSHPLSFTSLTNAINNKTSLEEEFKKLPISVPALEEVPEGAEAKNRYANVIPNPTTRVRLFPLNNESNSEYINANYVKGYGGKEKEYIATQAPLPETTNDFWRMVWEQQSRMILMLTQLEENGANRCAPYFPDNTHDCNRAYGDFQVSLQSKDVRENFVVSTFKLYEIERNLFREVIHLRYTAWPAHQVPEDHSSLLSFILETRNHPGHRSSGPLVVHCSPGTGRTGVVVAIDILMKEYEESRIVDVQRCVARLRHDRHGAVQTLQQYILIHDVLHDFIVKQGTQSQRPSLKSLMSLKLH